MKSNIDKLLEALYLVTSFKDGSRMYKDGMKLWEEVEKSLQEGRKGACSESVHERKP